MKNLILILLIVLVTACGKGGGGSSSSPAPVINPELYGHLWQVDYSVGPQLRSDQISATGNAVLFETYQTGVLIDQANWTIEPVSATTMRVSDGTDTFIVTYEISGNQMDLCFEDGTCSTFTH